MKLVIDLPDYSPESGFRRDYVDGYVLQTEIRNGEIIVRANNAGLQSLASWILTLTQPAVPDGYYFDVDTWSGLEDESVRLYVIKLPSESVEE